MSKSFLNSGLKTFQFKQFTVSGGNAGMPVSTDGVLLGAWANIEQAKQILDIGTGTGLLALMCAQRNLEGKITAIDIDDESYKIATLNINESPWKDRVNVHLGDITQVQFGQTLEQQFDHIICNPPYFNSGETAQQTERANARHTLTLSHQDLLHSCKHLLSSQGVASFILPSDEKQNFIDNAEIEGLTPLRICDVKTTPNKPFSRVLLEFGHNERNNLSQQDPTSQLTIYQDGQNYSAEFVELTRAFYLKM